MERARQEKALSALVAELVVTRDGRFYREAIRGVPDEHWYGFHLELGRALRPIRGVPYDPREPHESGAVRGAEKSDLLAEEYRRRKIEQARGRVERVARMEVPGVTGE